MSDSPLSFDLQKQQLELQKLERENKKLQSELEKIELEKKEITKPWYKKPAWWAILVPLLIGAGTIYVAFSTGIISIERLKREKEMLDLEIGKRTTTLKTIVVKQKEIDQFFKDEWMPSFMDNFFNLIKEKDYKLEEHAKNKASYEELLKAMKEASIASYRAISEERQKRINLIYDSLKVDQKIGGE